MLISGIAEFLKSNQTGYLIEVLRPSMRAMDTSEASHKVHLISSEVIMIVGFNGRARFFVDARGASVMKKTIHFPLAGSNSGGPG